MAPSSRTLRIGIALLISAGFIAAGYYFSSPFHINIVGATSTEAVLKEYAKKDTDGDGLADWQESLYGTDPKNAHSVEAALTDSEAVTQGKVALHFKSEAPETKAPEPLTDADFEVAAPTPGSATDEFAKSFFETYLTSGKGATGDNSALIANLMYEAKTRVAERVSTSYQASSVRSVPGTSVASYAAGIEAALLNNQVPDSARDAASVIDAYISKNDSSQKANLLAIAAAYKGIAHDLSVVYVPPALAATHLSFLRSADLASKAVAAMTDYETDPLITIGSIGIYQSASIDLGTALQAVGVALTAEGTPAPGAPGAIIMSILNNNGAL